MSGPVELPGPDTTDSFDRWAQAVQAQTQARQRTYADSWGDVLRAYATLMDEELAGYRWVPYVPPPRDYIDGEFWETGPPQRHALPAAPDRPEATE